MIKMSLLFVLNVLQVVYMRLSSDLQYRVKYCVHLTGINLHVKSTKLFIISKKFRRLVVIIWMY